LVPQSVSAQLEAQQTLLPVLVLMQAPVAQSAPVEHV
jgi:hypothetical protein